MESTKIDSRPRRSSSLVPLCAFFLFAVAAQGQTVPSTACTVTITSIKEGDQVGASATIKGTARHPVDGNLWILARKTSMGNQWWPQAGGAVEIGPRNGEWEAEVFFGRPSDIGSNFDVAAVVVNRQTSTELTKWFSTAKELDYPPIRFPDSLSGCPVVRVRVTKAR
jgi:hypothetical protein